eukprot:129789_1
MATDFDVDKHLKEFADELKDVGCSIYDIGSALQNQPEALKDKNWNAVAKKQELNNFLEIYTVVLSVIAYALKSKQISYKPSQNSIKALTMEVTQRLPQENDKPLLTKWDYENILHNMLHDIHQKTNPTVIAMEVDGQDSENNCDCIGVDCYCVKSHARQIASDPAGWIGSGNHCKLFICCILFTLCVAMASTLIHEGRMTVVDGQEDAGNATIIGGSIWLGIVICICFCFLWCIMIDPDALS